MLSKHDMDQDNKHISRPNNSEQLTHPKYRADIDGLRAVAVLSVVIFHAFPKFLKGGFIGVDIFFVISGFLISTIIFENLERNSFSFVEFYSRRIKRIFPALLLVLISSYIFGWFALFADEYMQLGKHIAAGSGFISNFVFWNESGYFDNTAETKPLLHLWTLGIEEQFYIIWPLLLWGAWKRKFNLLTITIVVAVASFVLNIKGIRTDAIATFYSPQTRFWELLTGSILAYSSLYKKNYKKKFDISLGTIIYTNTPEAAGNTLCNIQSLLGAALIGTGILIITKEGHFPGALALLPTLGAVLIISAGSEAWLNRVILSHDLLVWFGLISFPLYLWHWPLLSFARIVESGEISFNLRLFVVLIAVLFAWLTYFLIEMPIRFGKHSRVNVIVLCVLMMMLGTIGYGTYKSDGLRFRKTIIELEQQQAFASWGGNNNTQDACIKRYPFYGGLYSYCMQTDSDKAPTVALIGDSHANHLFFGFSEYYKGRGENLLNLGARLPFWNLETGPKGTDDTFVFYKQLMNDLLDYVVKSDSIKTIILASSGVPYIVDNGYHLKLTTNPNLIGNEKIFVQAMRETLERLVKIGKEIIFMIDIPHLGFDPKSCIDNRPLRLTTKIKSPCVIERNTFDKDTAIYHAVVKTVLQDFPTIKIFSAYKYFCDEKYCWAMHDGKILYRDESHLSYEGSQYIGSKFKESIESMGSEINTATLKP